MRFPKRLHWMIGLGLSALLVATPAARAQEDGPPSSSGTAVGVFFNPLMFAFGFYGLELAVSPMHALSINVSGLYYSKSISDVSTTAYGVNVGAQIFLTGTVPMQGAYVYPRIAYAKAKASSGSEHAEASLVGVGATVGYQWNWQPFALRLGGGVVYYAGSASGSSDVDISLKGSSPAIDLTLGFVF